MYGADALLRRGCRIPRSRALHALFVVEVPPPVETLLPLARLLDLLYDPFLFLLAVFFVLVVAALAFFVLVVVALAEVVDFLLLGFDADDADMLTFRLLPDTDAFRAFFFAGVPFGSTSFLSDSKKAFTPAPEPPIMSFRVLMQENEPEVFRLSSIWIGVELDRRRCQGGGGREDEGGSDRKCSASDNDDSESQSIV